MTRNQLATVAALGLAAAGGLAYLATKSAGPVQMTQFVEMRQGPLQEHLVTKEEIGVVSEPRMHYPPHVAPNTTTLVSQGFHFLFKPSDPAVAAPPSEEPW